MRNSEGGKKRKIKVNADFKQSGVFRASYYWNYAIFKDFVRRRKLASQFVYR